MFWSFARIAVSEREALATRSNTQVERIDPSLPLRVLTRHRGASNSSPSLPLRVLTRPWGEQQQPVATAPGTDTAPWGEQQQPVATAPGSDTAPRPLLEQCVDKRREGRAGGE